MKKIHYYSGLFTSLLRREESLERPAGHAAEHAGSQEAGKGAISCPENPGSHQEWLCVRRAVFMARVGASRYVSANFDSLVLGCIEADFCKQVLV